MRADLAAAQTIMVPQDVGGEVVPQRSPRSATACSLGKRRIIGVTIVVAVGWLVAAVLVAAIAAYLLQERRRLALDMALQQSRSELAVTATHLDESRRQQDDLANQLGASEEQRRSLETASARVQSDARITHAQLADAVGMARDLKERVERGDEERRNLADQITYLSAQYAALKTERDGFEAQLETQKTWVTEQTQQFERNVLAAAARIMDERGKAFTETNRREVDAVVAPFKERLDEFRRRVDEIHSAEARARGQLDEKIVQLTALNQAVSMQAERLTNALTISSKPTGDWGETILEKILEESGLREGKEYQLQASIRGEDGERLQPDAVIYLPEGRQLVVDSKVSNKAWTGYCAETDEALREERLREHLTSLRMHIKGLAAKNYTGSPDLRTVDFVLMFVPVEAALLTAFVKDELLYGDAYRSRIILVTPSTLMAVVKLVEGIWTFQKRQESADEIAEAGRKLYEKLTSFAASFVEVGAAIGKAREQFDKAQGQLATGKGHAIALAQRMVELGVTPSAGKAMPKELLSQDSDSQE
jgi:DNA recombination protein RmuC